ncbi:hypothetical protein PIB30_044110 [Stylosanthes scabra]|uniref:Uncharacterized protein n=1 Tax=Stylosanthes scabra TaxID=79078 RepID=A0ABU6QFZ8_9FABA|nr:hypothetical protein [Stylosanthes scabra]
MVSSVMVGRFPSKGDQHGLQGDHQGKRFSVAQHDSIVNSAQYALTPGKEKKSKEETRQNVGIVSVLLHGGRQCSRLVTGKEVLLECKYSAGLQRGRMLAAKAWNGRGWTCKATSTLKSVECSKESSYCSIVAVKPKPPVKDGFDNDDDDMVKSI